MNIVTRKYLSNLLKDWDRKLVTTEQLQDIAEQLFMDNDVDYEDWEGEGDEEISISNEVLRSLQMLDMDILLQKDISAYQKLLRTPKGKAQDGLKVLSRYISSIDMADRKEKYKNTKPYSIYHSEHYQRPQDFYTPQSKKSAANG